MNHLTEPLKPLKPLQSPNNSSHSNIATSVAILGAGLMGRMLAVALTQNQQACPYDVTLFDKDDEHGAHSAAYLAAAMLAPLAESADASKNIMRMGEHSLTLWPEFLKTLAKPVFFQREGSLILSHEQDQSYLMDFQRRLKNQDSSNLKTIKSIDIETLEPELSRESNRFNRGLFLPNEGQLDNRELLTSLAATIKQRNVTWLTNTPAVAEGNTVIFGNGHQDKQQSKHCSIHRSKHGSKPPSKNSLQHQHFDWVIDCRGLGAQDQTPQNKKLRGVRGEVIRVHAPRVNISRPVRLMHPRYPLYIAPKANHHFVIGATQIESSDQRNPTVRSALELLSSCFSVHKGFAEAEILEIKAGLRPALPNNEPKIWVHNQTLNVNGLYRHGYLLAPALVEQCLQIINSTQASHSNQAGLLKSMTPKPLFENLVEHIND